jgi:Protein of unknown function (DUF2946)
MRARLQKYLPIFLIALLVQVLAPIGVCWAAVAAASNPLSVAEICHTSGVAADQSSDQGGQHSQHGSECAVCCLVSAGASLDTPKLAAFAAPYRELIRVAWHDQRPDPLALRVGSNAQARAPPFSS